MGLKRGERIPKEGAATELQKFRNLGSSPPSCLLSRESCLSCSLSLQILKADRLALEMGALSGSTQHLISDYVALSLHKPFGVHCKPRSAYPVLD